MGRRWVLIIAGLAFFNLNAFAQIGVVVELPPTANVDAIAQHAGGAVVAAIPEANQFLLSVPAAPNNMSSVSDVRWMELNRAATVPSAPRPKYLRQSNRAPADWYKGQPSFTLINVQQALTYSSGSGVIIADINGRVDESHPALIGHLMAGYDFVRERPNGVTALDDSSASYLDDSSASYLDAVTAAYINDSSASYLDDSSASYLDGQNPAYSHGTLTAGIIAAVAPSAIIMPLRAFDDSGSSDTFTVARAIRYAVNHGAQVINMSFGTPNDTSVLQSAVAYALSQNVIVTASAGNDNTSIPQYPAGYSGVLTTAATNLQDVKASFSNYGTPVFVDAPGVNIISAFPGNLYGVVSGTSFSAPITAAAAALLLAEGANSADASIGAGAVNIDPKNPPYAGQLGHGRINVLKTVNPN